MITCLRLYFATWCMMAHWNSRCARSLCAKVSKTNICAKLPLILRKKNGHFVEALFLICVFHDTISFVLYFIKETSGLLVWNWSQKNPVLTKEKKILLIWILFLQGFYFLYNLHEKQILILIFKISTKKNQFLY